MFCVAAEESPLKSDKYAGMQSHMESSAMIALQWRIFQKNKHRVNYES